MIRAVLHLLNEQPLIADLYDLPKASDIGLVCTNLRTPAGKAPVFVDDGHSVFYFPYATIRFVEIAPGAIASGPGTGDDEAGASAPPEPRSPAEEELEIDEDFLRRVREA